MKTTALWALLLVTAFPLAGQTKSIYVPPVTGTGSGPEDNAYVRSLLVAEVRAQSFVLAQTRPDADFVLMGTIIDREMYYSYNFGVYADDDTDFDFGGMYVLHLVLQDNRSGEIEVEQDLLYNIQADIDTFFPVVSFYIFSRITTDKDKTLKQTETEDDLWRNKRWYFSAGAFWTPRFYVAKGQSVFWGNFGFGLSAEYRILNFLSVESGFGMAPEWVRYTEAGIEDRDLLLEIPLSVKFVIRPSSYSMLEPYAGMHFNIPLMGNSKVPLASWRLGLQYCVKAGPGTIFLDTRFAADLGTPVVEKKIGNETVNFEYQRYTVYTGIGYKLGIGTGPTIQVKNEK
jgi:hypothetical protein